MSRFFKSAAFPILIVVVLAFFAQRLISPGDRPEKVSFPEFLQQVENRQVERVEVKTRNNDIRVERRDGREYKTGFAQDYGDELTAILQRAEVSQRIDKFEVAGRGGAGGSRC
jgi:cell division protease FtsH